MTPRLLAMILLLASLVGSSSAEARILSFRCTVRLAWAKAPTERLIVVDTDQARVRDDDLAWQDGRSDRLHPEEMEHVHVSEREVEWGMFETTGGSVVDRYRIDLRTGGYRYDNAIRNFGRGTCRLLDMLS